VTRSMNETADVHLEGRDDTLPVSRSFLHLFRQM
jgi:DNA-binding LytR/AlgR family response regulator